MFIEFIFSEPLTLELVILFVKLSALLLSHELYNLFILIFFLVLLFSFFSVQKLLEL